MAAPGLRVVPGGGSAARHRADLSANPLSDAGSGGTPLGPPLLACAPGLFAAEPTAPVARVEELRDLPQLVTPLGRVGEVQRLALLADPRDHQRLWPHELLDPVLAVAEADPRVLPAAHRHVRGEEVHQDVVDAGGAHFEPAGHGLGLLRLAE